MGIGEILSNKRIPIKNALNRTPIFAPVQKRHLNLMVSEESPVLYEDRQYKLTMSGSKLNHTWDYPLLALIIKHWKNAVLNGADEAEPIQISLDELSELYCMDFDQKKRRNFAPVEASLERLQSACISLDVKKAKVAKRCSLIAQSEFHYGRHKKIMAWVGDLLKELYSEQGDFTYIDVDQLVAAPSERSKALMKYLLTQSKQYIDFKFELLVKLLGLNLRDTKQDARKDRHYIVATLNELVEAGFVTAYQTNAEVNWQHVRIVQHRHCADLEAAEIIIKEATSNFDLFKPNKNEKKQERVDAPAPIPPLPSSSAEAPPRTGADQDIPLP